MSYGPIIRQEEHVYDASSSQPCNNNASVMRDFLESEVDFEWPENSGKCTGTHCDIVGKIPLIWKKLISNKANASIDMYEAGPDFSFGKRFVVKTIRETDTEKARKMSAKEVENMKDLRHPHVTALLGTFMYQARLSILIFPAACCDLHQFMKSISRGFKGGRVVSHSDGTNTFDSDTINSRHLRDSNVGSASEESHPQEVHSESWPLTLPVDKKLEMLRGFFICLSQALSYLHSADVRHKDIKPENILIDESGSVILTDFGISRRFPKHTPHATNNERKFTRKYASPEIMKDNDTLRDDPSDVFPLGCVFLEMATLLLGENLNNFSDHYTTVINDSSKEEAYHCNLGNVYSWIDHLRTSRGIKPVQEHRLLEEKKEDQNLDPNLDNHMTAALVDIRQMLDENPSNRPKSDVLWERFQYVSATKCRDCDPRRRKENWKPSLRQQRDAQTGFNKRRSLHAIEEQNFKSKALSLSGDIDSTIFSNRLIPGRSTRSPRRGSSPSTNLQVYSRHGHMRTRSEPESPTAQLNCDSREDRAKAGRSSSPRIHIVQREETVLEETGLGSAQVSAPISPADIIYQTSAGFGRRISNNAESVPSLQLQMPQAAKPNLVHRLATRLNKQSQNFNQRRATGAENPASVLKENALSPQTRIIVYDVSQTIAFETAFASVKREYIPPA